jgi:DNA-binding GntR family transcriptional regulator
VAHQGKADQAHYEIERLIVFQELKPGALVSESLLMERTGLGRTPVREALQRLSRDRMVQIHPNRGVLIPPTSVEDQLRMLELRRVLESTAVALACQRAREDERVAMKAMVNRLRVNQFTLRDYAETVKDTHSLIVSAAHNEFLVDAMAPLQGLSRRFWFTHVTNEAKEITAGADLHARILTGILDKDEAAAQRASLDLNDYLVDFTYASLGNR